MKNRINSSFSSYHPGAKQYSAARNLINSVSETAVTTFAFSPIFQVKIIATGYVNTPEYFISPDGSFKTSKRTSKCIVDDRVVIVVSA